MDDAGQRHLCRIPEIAVEEARRTGCPLVHALVLLDLESSGGLNIFSAPRTPGCGQPHGTPVTQETWQAYLARRDECGPQGAGPLQLTWPPLADEADRLGGAWRPEINVRVGLEHFAGLLRTATVRDAYARWRYGQPESDVEVPPIYVERAMGLLPGWQQVIDGE